jgi:DNA-binding winged helix-turn-helix (wHTH) protein
MSTVPDMQDTEHTFRIGEWLILPELNRIERDGELIDIQPKLMSVLEELARAPGTVVTREHFQRSIWRDVAVSDDSLNRCITQLRRILGDDPRQPRFIETISKKGYRLVAEVTQAAPPPPESTTTTGTAAEAELVVIGSRILGYEARIQLRAGSLASLREGAIVVNQAHLFVRKEQDESEEPSTSSYHVRTRSFWAAAPFYLTPLAFLCATLLVYGHGLNAGTGAGLVLLVTVSACFAGIAISRRALEHAWSALRALASSARRRN